VAEEVARHYMLHVSCNGFALTQQNQKLAGHIAVTDTTGTNMYIFGGYHESKCVDVRILQSRGQFGFRCLLLDNTQGLSQRLSNSSVPDSAI
jgi:hypothetical protein